MKNILYFFHASLLVLLFSTSTTAQEGGGPFPQSSGKSIKFDASIKPTDMPTRFEPPREVPPGEIVLDRKVFWVHGHGGGIGSWDRAAAATQNTQVPAVLGYPARKITSHRLDYSGSHNAISAAGTDIKTQIETIAVSQTQAQKARNVTIAHSMGGLVSQYADYLYDTEADENRSFYGLVTFGTPNLGAVLAANAYPLPGSKAQQFANDACFALTTGPITEGVNQSFVLDLFLNNAQVQKLTQQFCDVLTEDVVSLLLKGFNTPIAGDLKPTSQIVGLLSNHTPEVTRRVAFYGVLDNQDLIWQTYHFLKNGPNEEPTFEAFNTQMTINKMNANKAKYKANRDYWQSRVEYWQNKVPFGGCWPFCNQIWECKENRDAWGKGYEWWNSANDKWRVLIGDLTLLPNNTGSCQCSEYNTNTQTYTPPYSTYGFYGNCTSGFQGGIASTCNFVTTFTLQDVESDGIVQASSAIALPGAVKSVELHGDSHFQMVNSPRTKVGLYDLWEGNHDLFFKTDKR